MAGKSSKSRADLAVDTVVSPSPPPYRSDAGASGLDQARPAGGGGARTSERVIVLGPAEQREGCLGREEVAAYLGRACSLALRARVDAHVAGCAACQRWVQHLSDEILEYVGGQLAPDVLASIDAHLEACNACRDLVHHVVQGMAESWHARGRDAADPGTTFLPGNLVNGRYRIVRFVGRGGMGEVYEAYDPLMDRRIALKTVLCTVADRPRAARRFKEEVRNAQRVGHRHVCRINDLQEHSEAMFGPPLPFFTMEFIDGERLGNRLASGPLPLDEARVIALQLLAGLEAAHARGVLHLDFKSDNVMLRRDGDGPDAVIMDFGLSRALDSQSRLRTSDRRQFAGTLPYMSVEQLECREVLGPATDVYAFGVVLYEMLTRALPFEGESLGAVLLEQLRKRPPPPSHHVRELSPALDRFVLRCLRSDPRERYGDAGEALVALRAVRSWRQTPLELKLRQSLPWAAGAVAMGAGIGIVAVAGSPAAAPVPSVATAALEASPPRSLQGRREASPAMAATTAPAPAVRAVEELTVPAPATALEATALEATALPAAAPARGAPAPGAPAAPSPAQSPTPTRATPPSASLLPAENRAPAGASPRGSAASVRASAASVETPRASDAARARAASPSPAPEPEAEPSAQAATVADAAWRPARVPRRLSVPAASDPER